MPIYYVQRQCAVTTLGSLLTTDRLGLCIPVSTLSTRWVGAEEQDGASISIFASSHIASLSHHSSLVGLLSESCISPPPLPCYLSCTVSHREAPRHFHLAPVQRLLK